MLRLRSDDPYLLPEYTSEQAAGADLKAAESTVLYPGERKVILTGVFIDHELSRPPLNRLTLPVLLLYGRSGLALKFGVRLANGVGVVDADYADEIGVILENTGDQPFKINKGDRIAQIVCQITQRIPGLHVGGERKGGFGSSGIAAVGVSDGTRPKQPR